VATYQSVSGAGKSAMEALARQTAELLNGKEITGDEFSRQMAFNVIPQIDVFMDNDYTKEEMKMVWETHKIMGDESIMVNPTAVRVPVFFGHGEAIHIETTQQIDAQAVKELLAAAPGVTLYDERESFPTQVSSASGNDSVHVGRVRNDVSHPHGINLWVVSDNIRKGAATNSVQIAEVLINEYM
jgi:aspartate-semialdehyde dehydrogenase